MENTPDASMKFSQTFTAWYKYKLPAKHWLKDEYVNYDAVSEDWFLNADFESLYQDYFDGARYDGALDKTTPDFMDVGRLIQLSYNRLVRPEHQQDFAAAVNVALTKFDAPLTFINGDFAAPSAREETVRRFAANGMAHKIAAVVFLALMLLSMLQNCSV